MAGFIKYRVHELGKDFGVTSKVIIEILSKHFPGTKNHMTSLEDRELDVVFEHFTQQHQVESFDEYMKPAYEKLEQPQETPAAAQTPPQEAAAQKPAPGGESRPAPAGAGPAKQPQQPAAAQAQKPKQPQQPAKPRRDGVRIVDTRTSNVNLARYDERIDALVPEKVKDVGAEKQKLVKKQFNPYSNKRGGHGGRGRRETEADKLRRIAAERAKQAQLKVQIPDEIVVSELATRLKRTNADVVKKLMQLGVVASVSQTVDFDTASIVAEEFGAKVEHEIIVTIEERLIDDSDDSAENLQPRDPVVVVMGHVDHGKTSLLDAIRNANVVEGEAGGITQHIGAYRVKAGGRDITFLDTPGHEAFTAMRLRGAQVTDIAILVVAADDGIMPQTIEAINHAKAAEVSIIVAINKIDKPEANPQRIKQELTEHGLLIEEWGGDTICVEVSAKTRQGLDGLLDMVLLAADMRELKANPARAARGTVIEAKLDRGRGPVATVLVQNGTLHLGDTILAGTTVGRVRVMTDDRGRRIKDAGPSVPAEIVGLSEVPLAGDVFHAVDDEKMARELVEQRKFEVKQAVWGSAAKVSLDDLFKQISEGMKELKVIVKADVMGSAEAVRASLEKLSNDEVRVRVIHSAAGAINESDVMLAATSNAIIVGFNVRPDSGTIESANTQGVDMRTYRVIYECIDEIEAAMKGLLAPKFREVILGHAQVRQVFKVTGVGTVAGCHVQDGKITRGCSLRLIRDGIVITEGAVSSLKRFKDDVREVAAGYDCGLGIERYGDIKEGDMIEAFQMEEYKD